MPRESGLDVANFNERLEQPDVRHGDVRGVCAFLPLRTDGLAMRAFLG